MIRRRSSRSIRSERNHRSRERSRERRDCTLGLSGDGYDARRARRDRYYDERSEESGDDYSSREVQVIKRRDLASLEIVAREDYDGRSITSSKHSEDGDRRRRHRSHRDESPQSSESSPSAAIRKYHSEGSRSGSLERHEARRDGRARSRHRDIDVHSDELEPEYWDHSAQAYTEDYHNRFPYTGEAIRIAESSAPDQIQAKIDSIVWDFAGRDMLIRENVYKKIVYAICGNEFGTISGVSRDGLRMHFSIGGWSEEAWTDRIKYVSPFGEGLQCRYSCPLRDYHQKIADPALPTAPATSVTSRRDACSKLYSKISQWQTRILILEPGVFGSELEARLVVADIVRLPGVVLHEVQELIEFTALSYTWGTPLFARLISINGVLFPITENLFAFFQRYRHEKDVIYLWIDAICINQLDLEEKSMQVKNMLTIYDKAEGVVVWLGEESQCTKLAVVYLKWTYMVMQEYRKLESEVRSDQFAAVDSRHVWHPPKCAQHFPNILSGLEDLCNRDWIRRIWIRQEVWAANKIEVYCGSTAMSWDEFLFAAQIHLRSKETNRVVPRLVDEHVSCFKYLRRRNVVNEMPDSDDGSESLNAEMPELLVLLNECISCQYTVQHDLIYSLLGMASVPRSQRVYRHVPEVEVRIDYQQSIENVFSELAMSVMHVKGPHSILATAPRLNQHIPLALPTWVPDFRNGHDCKLQGHLARYAPDLSISPSDRSPDISRYDGTAAKDTGRERNSELLTRFQQLNKGVQSTKLLLEGLCVGELSEESSRMESDLHVCLINTEKYHRYDGMRYKPPRDRHEWHQQGSKPMTYQLQEWFIDIHDTQHDEEGFGHASRRRSKLSSFDAYSESLGIMSVPVSASKGDLLVIIPLLATPLIFRKLLGRPESAYHLIGCAWLYVRRDSDGEYARDTAESVMMELNSFHNIITSSPVFKDRLEIFTIE